MNEKLVNRIKSIYIKIFYIDLTLNHEIQDFIFCFRDYNLMKNKKQFHLTTINLDQCFTLAPQPENTFFSQIFKHRKATPKNIHNFLKNKPNIQPHNPKNRTSQISKQSKQKKTAFYYKLAEMQINRQSFKHFLRLKNNKKTLFQLKEPKESQSINNKIQKMLITEKKVNHISIQRILTEDNCRAKTSKGQKSRKLINIVTTSSQKSKTITTKDDQKVQNKVRRYSGKRINSASVFKNKQPPAEKQRMKCNTLQPWGIQQQGFWQQIKF